MSFVLYRRHPFHFFTHYHITQKYPPYWLSSKKGIYQWNNVFY
nr:MAG TPA: hypothetical protein [Caudoviricetes sp.]